jgi:hypothetical protein
MGVRGESWSGVAVGVLCAVRMQWKMLTSRNTKRMVQISGTGVETNESDSET